MIFPDYKNNIVNVSATISKWLGNDNDIPQIKSLQDELEKNPQNVIFMVVDGLGKNILEKHLAKDSFLRKNIRQTLTTVFPSTTTCATTTLASATYPAEHGWLSWAMNFPENKTVELFRDTDYYTGKPVEKDFAFDNLPFKLFFSKPSKAIEVHACATEKIRIHKTANDHHAFTGIKGMFKEIKKICRGYNQKFVYVYTTQPDATMHSFGIGHKKVSKIVHEINDRLEKFMKKHPETLVVLTADHGHIDLAGFIHIHEDKEITDCLASPFSGEARAAFFHIKKNMHDKFKRAFEKYAADFDLYETKDLIKKGVFGDFKDNGYEKFLGDYIAAGKDTNKAFVFAPGKEIYNGNAIIGHHTGMTADEMQVPLVIISS